MCLDFLAFSSPSPPLTASRVLPYFQHSPCLSCDSVHLPMAEPGQCQPSFPRCLLPQLNQTATGMCFPDFSSHSSNCSHKEYICLVCQHLEKLWRLQLMIHSQSPDISKGTRRWRGRNPGHQTQHSWGIIAVFPRGIQPRIFSFHKY